MNTSIRFNRLVRDILLPIIDDAIREGINNAITDGSVPNEPDKLFSVIKTKFYLPKKVSNSETQYLAKIIEGLTTPDTLHKIQSKSLPDNFVLLDKYIEGTVGAGWDNYDYSVKVEIKLNNKQKLALYESLIVGYYGKMYYSNRLISNTHGDFSVTYEEFNALNEFSNFKKILFEELIVKSNLTFLLIFS